MERKDVSFNQTVGLEGDPAFRGYIFAESAYPDLKLGPVMLVSIKEPGATGMRGIKLFLLSDLVKLTR